MSGRLQIGMIAKPRDIDAGGVTRLDDGLAPHGLNLDPINREGELGLAHGDSRSLVGSRP